MGLARKSAVPNDPGLQVPGTEGHHAIDCHLNPSELFVSFKWSEPEAQAEDRFRV